MAPISRETPMPENEPCHLKILVAEDDQLFAATVDDFLSQAGFCVSLSHDGQQALETASKTPVAALLTDLRMPRLDGITLVRALRQTRPELPVVVLTGYPPVDWRSALQRSGEGPLILLEKPVRLANLIQALRQVLGCSHSSVASE